MELVKTRREFMQMDCRRHNYIGCLQLFRVVIHDDFHVKEGNALELEQGMIERMCDVISHPLGDHHGNHDGQQEGDVIRDLDLVSRSQ